MHQRPHGCCFVYLICPGRLFITQDLALNSPFFQGYYFPYQKVLAIHSLFCDCITLCTGMSYKFSTEVVCHSLLQEIFLTQGSNHGLLYYRQILHQLNHQKRAKKKKVCKQICKNTNAKYKYTHKHINNNNNKQ